MNMKGPYFAAGCSIADELFTSFDQLLKLADRKGVTYDRYVPSDHFPLGLSAVYIAAGKTTLCTGSVLCTQSNLSVSDRFVLENSGVAEPQNIRDKFSEAIASGHPLMSRIQLDTMVTIVDSGSFTADYSSRTPVSGILTALVTYFVVSSLHAACIYHLHSHTAQQYCLGVAQVTHMHVYELAKGEHFLLFAARPDLGEGGNLRPVVDLLVEQIECADFVILNKIDQLDAAQMESLKGIAASLNPLAKVCCFCTQSIIPV